MTRDALAGTQQIGMVTVRPDSLAEIAGNPPIFDVGCVGRIAHAQERPDGTFQIMLLGESRFRILEEDPPRPEQLYRTARVELLAERLPETADERASMQKSRNELLVLLERLVRGIGSTDDPDEVVQTFARLESPRLVNALTQSIDFSPIERQQLLEAESITGRFEIMGDLLRFRLAEIGAGESGTTHLPN
jgi:Lon protease-like protein